MIFGTITAKDGTVIPVTDENLVQNGLSLSASMSAGGRFDIGTFHAAELKISIFDENAAGREFDGAVIALREGETEEKADAVGVYYVCGDKTVRKGKTVSLTAYDAAILFDIEVADEYRIDHGSTTPEALLSNACAAAGVPLSSKKLDGFPNYDASIAIPFDTVWSWRDAVMWTAQLLCANAVIDREGALEIRPIKYASEGSTILTDHLITADQRVSIRFSDIRTYIKYLTAYAGGVQKNYTSSLNSADEQARAAEFQLPKNPLIDSDPAANECNKNWLAYIDGFKQREIDAKVFGTAKIQLGDTCRFSGGVIDVRGSIVGVVTDLRWNYNGLTRVICRAPQAVVKEDA